MTRRLLTPEREAQLLARYPTEGNNALALDFGLTAQQVAHIAYENHVTKTPATRATSTPRGAAPPPASCSKCAPLCKRPGLPA